MENTTAVMMALGLIGGLVLLVLGGESLVILDRDLWIMLGATVLMIVFTGTG